MAKKTFGLLFVVLFAVCFVNFSQIILSENNLQIVSVAYAETQDEALARQKFNEGYKLYKNKDYEGAISKFTEAIKLNPNHYAAYRYRGGAYENIDIIAKSRSMQNFPQAISDYTKAIEINPNYLDAYMSRGGAYRILGNAYKLLGDTYKLKKNYEQAIEDYTQVIKLRPDYWEPYYLRGECYKALGQDDKAKADREKSRQLGW